MPEECNKRKRIRGILLALLCTAVTAGAPLALAAWMVLGTVGAFLSKDSRDANKAVPPEAAPQTPAQPAATSMATHGTDMHWRHKEQRIAVAVATGRPETFRFSADELNEMIDAARQRGEFEGEATIDLRDSMLSADVNMPVTGVPILEGHFLNARLQVELALEKSGGRLYIRRIAPRSQDWRTRMLLRSLVERDLAPLLEKTPFVDELRESFQRIAIEDETLVVVTRDADVNGDQRNGETN